MVGGGKADVELLNKYLKDYNDSIYGRMHTSSGKKTTGKEGLLEQMKGFRSVFGDKGSFKARAGKKLEGEISNISMEELMKENK